MLGFGDVMWIFLVTTVGNLVVEVGAEVIAEWVVESPDSPIRGEQLGEQFGMLPDPGMTVTEVSTQLEQLHSVAVQASVWSAEFASAVGPALAVH